MFDWLTFLNSRGIPYVTSGPNVARGRVAIKCPWCGDDDPSEHLGIDLHNERWGCLRRSEHRGGSPVKLISMLAGCSLDQAREIAGKQRFIPEDFHLQVEAALNPVKVKDRESLILPNEFRNFANVPSAWPFINYLMDEKRGAFRKSDILRFTKDFDIFYAKQGPFRKRVIFTIWVDGKLQCWTGRSIEPDAELRYRALTVDQELAERIGLEPALAATADLLLWYDDLMESDCDTIVLCEGPFDALKVRLLGEREGITATCFFTMNSTERQQMLLYALLPRFKRRFILLDQGTLPSAMRVQSNLVGLNVEIAQLPPKVKDPALLTTTEQLLSVLEYA